MKCPLCAHEGIDANTTICPACKADLTAFQALGNIETSLKKQKKTSLLFMILFLAALLVCLAIIFFALTRECNEEQQKLEQCELLNADMNSEIQQIQQQMAELQAENTKLTDELAEIQARKSITHVIREGETLFIIARNYLGDGALYTKIAADNGIDDPNLISTGKTIIIKP